MFQGRRCDKAIHYGQADSSELRFSRWYASALRDLFGHRKDARQTTGACWFRSTPRSSNAFAHLSDRQDTQMDLLFRRPLRDPLRERQDVAA